MSSLENVDAAWADDTISNAAHERPLLALHVPGMGSLRWQIGPLGRYLSNQKTDLQCLHINCSLAMSSLVTLMMHGENDTIGNVGPLLAFAYSGHGFAQMADRTTGPIFE